jgi:pectate lyase
MPGCWSRSSTAQMRQQPLQAALTAAAGGKPIVPRGKTVKTKQVTIPANTDLAGEGAGSVIDLIDDGTAASQTIYIHSVAGVTIHDLTIKSSNATGRTAVNGLVRIGQSSGVIIRNVRFGRSPSTAVYGEQSDGVLVEGCTVTDSQADGIHISRGCTRWRVINNNLTALAGDDAVGVVSYTSTAAPWAICEDIIIEGNQVKSTTVGRGIAIVGGKNVIARGNTITDVYQSGIIVSSIYGDTSASTHYYRRHRRGQHHPQGRNSSGGRQQVRHLRVTRSRRIRQGEPD